MWLEYMDSDEIKEKNSKLKDIMNEFFQDNYNMDLE